MWRGMHHRCAEPATRFDGGAAPAHRRPTDQARDEGADGAESRTAALRATSLDEVLTVLRTAMRDESPVFLDYATPAGVESTAEVVPLTLSGGYLTAITQPGLVIETYSLARITGVEAVPTRQGH